MDTVKLCPLCRKEIVEEGRGGYGRCSDPLHDWVLYVEFALLTHSALAVETPSHKTRLDSLHPKGNH